MIGLSGILLAACTAPAAEKPAAAAPPPAVAAAPPPAPAPPPASAAPPKGRRPVAVARVQCEVLLSAAPDDRAAASMFYLGYEAAMTHTRTVDIGHVEEIEKHALHYCLEHPHALAATAYRIAIVWEKHLRH
jgi:pyruvate/2-oxoglutarate dehydrogenase complex dihydrolipoamide acyltransferase (E2) component